jgi:hypothetical protein
MVLTVAEEYLITLCVEVTYEVPKLMKYILSPLSCVVIVLPIYVIMIQLRTHPVYLTAVFCHLLGTIQLVQYQKYMWRFINVIATEY